MKKLSTASTIIFGALVAGAAHAQTFKTIRRFSGTDPSTVMAPLVRGPDGNLYGASVIGGANDSGTVFRTTTRGVLTVLHSFLNSELGPATVTFGPDGNLFMIDETGLLQPTIVKMAPDGTALSTLRVFDPTKELLPMGDRLTIGRDGNLYGLVENHDVWNSFRLSPAGAYTSLSSYNSSPSSPQLAVGLSAGLDGNMYAISLHGGDFNQGTFFRLGTDGAVTVLHSFTQAEGPPASAFTVDRNGDFYGVVQPAASTSKLLRITTAGVVTAQLPFRGDSVLGQDPPPVLGVDGNFYGTMELGDQTGNGGTAYRLTPSGDFSVVHEFVDLADGHSPNGLVMGSDGLLYGTTSASRLSTEHGVEGGTFYKLGLPWALAFDGGDATVPWQFPDWQYGEYKAECPFPGSLPLGLSVWPGNAGASAGAAHSVLCKEPLAQDSANPFGYFQAHAGEPLTVNESIETFYDHDSTHVGSRPLPQFPNNDWDPYFYKGECAAGAFITGIAQTGDWTAPTDSGVGMKPPRTLDHLLCSRTRCDTQLGPYTAGNTCTTRTLPGDDPVSLPDGDWANQFYKLECGSGEAMVGISVDTTAHRPHKILCCQLERTVC